MRQEIMTSFHIWIVFLLYFFLYLPEFTSISNEVIDYFHLAVAKHSHAPAEALEIYEQILSIDDVFPEAHQNLATLYEHFGKVELALYHHEQAYRYSTQLYYPLTKQIQLKVNILSLQLKLSNAVTNLQILLWIEECEQFRQSIADLNKKTIEEAKEGDNAFQQLIREPVELLFTLGLLYQRLENFRKAMDCFQTIINEHDGDHTLSWLNIGNYFFLIRDYSQAIHYYSIALEITLEKIDQQLLSLHPNYSEVLTTIGLSESELLERKSQLLMESKVINRLNPLLRNEYNMITSIANNLGQSYRENGAFQESIRIFLFANDYATLLHYMNHPEALSTPLEESPFKMIQIPKERISTSNLYFLITIFMMKSFLNHFQDYEYLETLLLQQVRYSQLLLIDSYLKSPDSLHYHQLLIGNSNGEGVSIFDPYTLSLLRYASSELDLFVTQQNCPMKLYPSEENNLAKITRIQPPVSSRDSGTIENIMIRVGYLSFDWRDHPMGRLTAGIVTTTKIPNTEIYCFSYGYNDRSEVRRYVSEYCHTFVDISRMTTDLDIAKLIHSYHIDLLIDITSHTYHNRMKIMSYQPAPVIVNYLGYPGTTGCIPSSYHHLSPPPPLLPENDSDIRINDFNLALERLSYPLFMKYNYTFVDRNVIPPDYLTQRSTLRPKVLPSTTTTPPSPVYYRIFSEQLVYLPFSYQSNYMPLSILFPPLSDQIPSSISHRSYRSGKSESISNLCVLNANKKFEPTFIHILANLLQSYRLLTLRFLDVAEQSQQQLQQLFAYYGIDTQRSPSRIQFLERESWQIHLSRIARECEGVLDTFVYGGHTTSTDVLWMGIPIFTVRGYGLSHGARMPSRVASSLLTQIDETEKIGKSSNTSTTATAPTFSSIAISSLLAVDTLKDYEESIGRFLSTASDTMSKKNKFRVIRHQILQRSCVAPIFDLSLMQRTLHHVYELLYEQNYYTAHYNDGISSTTEPSKQYHLILSKDTISSVDKKEINYCQQEGYQWLQSRLNQTLSFHTAEKETILSVLAIRQRLIRGMPKGSRELQVLLTKRLEELLLYRLNSILFVNDDSQVEGVRLEERLRDLLLEDIMELQSISAFHSPHSPEFLSWIKILVKSYITALKNLSLQSIESNQQNLSLDLLQSIIFQPFRAIKEAIPLILSSPQTLLSTISNEQKVSFEIEMQSYLFREVSSIFLDSIFIETHHHLLSRKNTIITNIEEILFNWKWEEIIELFFRENNHKDQPPKFPINLSSRQQQAYHLLLQQLFSLLFDYIIPNHSTDDYPLMIYRWKSFFTFSQDVMDFLQKELVEQFTFHEELLALLTHSSSSLPSYSINQFLQQHFFLHSYQLWMLSPGLHAQQIFHFGIHWNNIIQNMPTSDYTDTPSKKELLLLIGYTCQSIGSRLLISEKRFNPLITYANLQDLLNKQRVITQAEGPYQSLLSINRKIIIYAYEYEQQWWPGWGPSSVSSTFYQTNITQLLQPISNIPSSPIRQEKNEEEGQAMGGSEEAVVYLASELMKLGYTIEIYTSDLSLQDQLFTAYERVQSNNPQSLGRIGKVQWFHYLQFNSSRNDIDIFISWRYALSLPLGRNAKQLWLWLHDLVPREALPPLQWLTNDNPEYFSLKGIFTQSSFHQKFIQKQYLVSHHSQTQSDMNVLSKVKILPNGVHLPSFINSIPIPSPPLRNPHLFIYSSAPTRGLVIVLLLWSKIMAINPMAELHIYYGFTSQGMIRLQQQMGIETFQQWYQQIQQLLNQPNIYYHGAVNHHRLFQAFQQGSFLLYPSTFPETGCITMMKAMISGMLPITSRYQSSVLASLGEEFDLGPSKVDRECQQDCALTDQILQNETRWKEWIENDYYFTVLRAIESVTSKDQEVISAIEMKREHMIQRMKTKYLWSETAKWFVDYATEEL